MAYYQVLNTNDGMKYDPGFMQNVTALSNVLGKNIQSQIFKDAAAKNGLIPEIEDDNQNGVKINYKSPALVNRGYYSAGGPGNTKPKSVSDTIKDMLATQAVKNASDETASYGPELGGSVGLPEGSQRQADGTILDQQGNQIGEAPVDQKFPQPIGADPTAIFQSALKQEAANDPSVAKAIGIPKSSSSKETLDEAVSAAAAGDKTWAEVYRQFPTKISQIQKARQAMANTKEDNTDNSTETYQENQTATNPKTGERMIYKGGKWQQI